MTVDGPLVPQELCAALATHAGRPALRDRDHCLDYADLARFVAAARPTLAGHGVVAIHGAPGALFAAAAVAAVIAGRPFVHLDPAMPDAVLDNIVAALSVELVLAVEPPRPGRLAQCDIVEVRDLLTTAPADTPPRPAPVRPDDPIYIVATSGTTGTPKCIPVTQEAAALSYRWREGLAPYRPGMAVAAYIFALWEMLRPLRHGAQVVFPAPSELLSPRALAGFLVAHGVEEMLFTPSLLAKTLSGLDAPSAAALPLRRIILNGEVVGDDLLAAAHERLAGVRIWNLYSICETHDVAMVELPAPAEPGAGLRVGRAMPHLRAVVLDEAGRPVRGTPGRLHLAGPRMLGPGYVGRPEETAERFRDVRIEGRAVRAFDTGDLARIDEGGEIVVLGRAAHMLKLRGHSIQTADLIEAMAEEVAFGTAIAQVKPTAGGDRALVVYYTADEPQMERNRARWGIGPGQTRMPTGLAEVLGSRLPGFCVPSYLIHLDALPLHPVSGKCDLASLPDIAPTMAARVEADLPRTVVEAARILRIAAGELAADRSFRDHGGDSLQCVDLVLSLERAYDRRVDFDWALSLPLGRLDALLAARGETACGGPGSDRPGVLLTGATGFLGRHVLRALARALPEERTIYCLIRPGEADPQVRLAALAKATGIPPGRIALVAGGLEDPAFGLPEPAYDALADRVDGVIHCAATVNLALGRAELEAWSAAGIEEVLRFCRQAGAALRFTSSTAVFPDRGGPHPEAAVVGRDGLSGYGAAKLAAETRIAASGVDAAIVRLPSLYDLDGPNDADLYEAVLRASRAIRAIPEGLAFPMVDVHAAAAFLAGIAPHRGVDHVNLVGDEPVCGARHAPGIAHLPREDWLARAPLPPLMAGLIARDLDCLCADATFETARARALWCDAGHGDPSALSDPHRLLRLRLAHQSEPAFT